QTPPPRRHRRRGQNSAPTREYLLRQLAESSAIRERPSSAPIWQRQPFRLAPRAGAAGGLPTTAFLGGSTGKSDFANKTLRMRISYWALVAGCSALFSYFEGHLTRIVSA